MIKRDFTRAKFLYLFSFASKKFRKLTIYLKSLHDCIFVYLHKNNHRKYRIYLLVSGKMKRTAHKCQYGKAETI